MYQPKTLEQVKETVIEHARELSLPMQTTLEEDVRRACDKLQSLDSDHWCQVWSEIAQPYEERGLEQERAGNDKEAERNYMLAYSYYRVARFPVPNTPAKKAAYGSSIDNYLKASRYFAPPLERVLIPFAGKGNEGKEIPAYLQKPKGVERPPVLITHGGIDGFKEERGYGVHEFLSRGVATLAMDMPGTGQSPILGSINAERLYDPVITYLQNRPDLDGTRIGLMGGSFGGYWAAKIAHMELERLKIVVSWGGSAHYNFLPDWQRKCQWAPTVLGNEDLITTRSNSFGIYSFDEWLEFVPSLSLLTQGILEGPCVPMLLVNGKDDTQVPIEDLYLLLEHGSPKTARVFPGGHMGNTPQTLPTIADWVASQLSGGTK
ncbi:alpha/beta hydrolase family protein [Chloroflexota bacterium]